jgi:hypothetical protein
MLFGHPDIISFPETFFFVKVTPGRPLARLLGLSARHASAGYRELWKVGLSDHGRERAPRRLRDCALDFTTSLDAATLAAGKRLWLEKTPSHLHYADSIQRYVPAARFVHIVRDGAGVIPSLFEVTNRFSDEWDGARSLEQCIARWRQDVGLSAAHGGDPRHAFVAYERLVESPEAVLRPLIAFLGLTADEATIAAMLGGRSERLGRVARDEPWKHGVAGPIANEDCEKIERRVAPAQRNRVLDAVAAERPTLEKIPFLGQGEP